MWKNSQQEQHYHGKTFMCLCSLSLGSYLESGSRGRLSYLGVAFPLDYSEKTSEQVPVVFMKIPFESVCIYHCQLVVHMLTQPGN